MKLLMTFHYARIIIKVYTIFIEYFIEILLEKINETTQKQICSIMGEQIDISVEFLVKVFDCFLSDGGLLDSSTAKNTAMPKRVGNRERWREGESERGKEGKRTSNKVKYAYKFITH